MITEFEMGVFLKVGFCDLQVPENQNGDSRLRTHKFAVDYCYDPLYPETCTQEAVSFSV